MKKLEGTLDHATVAIDEGIVLMRTARALLAQLEPTVAALPQLVASVQRLAEATALSVKNPNS